MARGSMAAQPIEFMANTKPAEKDLLALYAKALAGDMVLVVTPATDTPAPTALAWEQDFYVEVQSAAGEVHSWFNKAVATGHSVAESTAGGGVASADPATTTTFVNGIAKITVSGTAGTWANADTATLTVAAIVILGYTLAQKTGVLTFTTPA